MIAWVILGIVVGLTIWAAYALGKDHGAGEANNYWTTYDGTKWTYNTTKRLVRLQNDVAFWQGKFNAVKHENNQLRRKLRNQND